MSMTPTRPYLIRAFYDWISDNHYTPHIIVDAGVQNVMVPDQYVENGQIVLNISMGAVHNLDLGVDSITFSARFAGIIHNVYIPTQAVVAIYAKENGRGMVFSDEEDTPPPAAPDDEIYNQDGSRKSSGSGGTGKKGSGKKPNLTLVK